MARHIARKRGGFTILELMVVLAIALILMGIAGPPVVSSVRRASVRGVSGSIMEVWRQARQLAMSRQQPAPLANGLVPHYGIAVVQSGSTIKVGLILDTRASLSAGDLDGALLRAGVWDASTDGISWKDAAQRPARLITHQGSAVLSTLGQGGKFPADLNAGDQVLVWYAQYRTGFPIAAADVAAGKGQSAAAMGIGVSGSAMADRLVLSTVDFDPVARKGFGTGVGIYHIGVAAQEDL